MQALCRVPVLPQMLRQVTDDEPMRSANALAQALTDGRDVVDVTVFGGFPLADSPVTGPSVLVVGGAGRAAAADAARRIAAVLWDEPGAAGRCRRRARRATRSPGPPRCRRR